MLKLNRWLSTRLQYLQCISNENTAVLPLAIEIIAVSLVEEHCSLQPVCHLFHALQHHYDPVHFLPNTHNWHPIAPPCQWNMVCFVSSMSGLCCICVSVWLYLINFMLTCIIRAPDCMYNISFIHHIQSWYNTFHAILYWTIWWWEYMMCRKCGDYWIGGMPPNLVLLS